VATGPLHLYEFFVGLPLRHTVAADTGPAAAAASATELKYAMNASSYATSWIFNVQFRGIFAYLRYSVQFQAKICPFLESKY